MLWKKKYLSNNESLVLYQLEKINELDIKYGTNTNVEEFTFFPEEKEILFFPFSCFEVIKTKEEKNKEIETKEGKVKENFYTITLSYLGKYRGKINKQGKVPETSFIKNILRKEVLDKLEMKNDSKTIQFDFNFEKYITEDTKRSYIKATYSINNENINQAITILNYDNSNEDEIRNNCDIYYENKKIEFTCEYKFDKPGNYTFKFIF